MTHTVTEIGSTLGGRYRLLELLGQGGMATIYRARDAQLERDVAVKLLRPEFGQDPDFLARFRDEARAAASLSHPNIVPVFDFGEDAVRARTSSWSWSRARTWRDPPRQRAARPAPGRPHRRRRRPRPPGRPLPRHRPPRREAVEHPGRPRRPRPGRRLRDRPRHDRGAGDAARDDDGLGPLLQPRAGPRRDRRPPRPTSTRWASSCSRCSPGSGRSPATARRPSRWRASRRPRRARPRSGRPCRRSSTRSSPARWRSNRPTATPRPRRWPARSRASCGADEARGRGGRRRARVRPSSPPRPGQPTPIPYPPSAYARPPSAPRHRVDPGHPAAAAGRRRRRSRGGRRVEPVGLDRRHRRDPHPAADRLPAVPLPDRRRLAVPVALRLAGHGAGVRRPRHLQRRGAGRRPWA